VKRGEKGQGGEHEEGDVEELVEEEGLSDKYRF